MALVQLKLNPTQRELRQFAACLLFAAAGLGALLWFKYALPSAAVAVWILGGLCGWAGLIWPAIGRPVWIALMIASFPVGWIISHFMLAAMWYLCLTPIGLAMRLCRFDPLDRIIDRSADSYWKAHQTIEDKKRYYRQF